VHARTRIAVARFIGPITYARVEARGNGPIDLEPSRPSPLVAMPRRSRATAQSAKRVPDPVARHGRHRRREVLFMRAHIHVPVTPSAVPARISESSTPSRSAVGIGAELGVGLDPWTGQHLPSRSGCCRASSSQYRRSHAPARCRHARATRLRAASRRRRCACGRRRAT
jgi:hypothetical protein